MVHLKCLRFIQGYLDALVGNWISLHSSAHGWAKKPKKCTTLLGKSQESTKMQIGSGNTILTDERHPVKETEKGQSQRCEESHAAKAGRTSNQGMSDDGHGEKGLVEKELKRLLALALEEDL